MMRRKKIVIVPALAEEGWLSMDLYFDKLVHHLRGMQPNDLEIAPLLSPMRSRKRNMRVNKLFRKYAMLPRLIRETQADLVHIVDHSYAYLAAMLKGIPCVLTCHDAMGDIKKLYFSPPWKRPLFWLMIRGLNKARWIMCTTPYVQSKLPEQVIGKMKHSVNELGVEAPNMDNLSNSEVLTFKRKLGIPAGSHVLLHVGSNFERKNVELVVRVLSFLTRKHNLNVVFLKVGENLERTQLALAGETNVLDRIIDAGRLPTEKLLQAIAASTVLIYPSTYEGFGWPPFEAAAMGIPSLLPPLPVFRHYFDESSAYFVRGYEPESWAFAAAYLLENVDERVRLGRNAKKVVQRFRWENHASTCIDVYRKVLNS